jgi:glutamate--cysteine ligase
MKHLLHDKIVAKHTELQKWYKDRVIPKHIPFYCSFDIRDSGFKIAPVDANLYPAGFNNICQTDKESSFDLAKDYIQSHYGSSIKNIGLLVEEHTSNFFYWDNVYWIKTLLTEAGYNVRVLLPNEHTDKKTFKSASGFSVEAYPITIDPEGRVSSEDKLDLIISNNDFSTAFDSWAKDVSTPINPPLSMGWHSRTKDSFFKVYNELVEEFCEITDLSCAMLKIKTETFDGFDLKNEESISKLTQACERFFDELKADYEKTGIPYSPYMFIKNNAGTYGLGIIEVKNPTDIQSWNYKSRKKMKAAKGGRDIHSVILQEGIPTIVKNQDDFVAEPAIYMIGSRLAGGFLRVNERKGPEDNLNAPGAVFSRLCVSDLEFDHQGKMMENVYGWVAKLAMLAISREFKTKGIELMDKNINL